MGKVKIGDFLHRIKRPIVLNPNVDYKLVTIKMHHKGVVLRDLKKGSEIKSKMYEVKKGDFILSGIDARNGAFGIVPEELDGAIVTNDFWYFSLDEEVIDKHFFLELTSTSWFDEICRLGSDGTTQRIRLQKDKFFNQEINLPPLDEQQNFISKFIHSKTINNKIEKEIDTQQELLKKLRQSILQEAIEGKLTKEWREQNPDIESASVLLEKIKQEKEQLIKEKKIKKQKPLPQISEDEMIVPEHKFLKWCRLSDLFVIEKGNTGIKKAVEGEYPLVVTAEERLSHNEYQIDGEAIIIPLVSSTGHGHASLNRIHYQKGKFAVGSILAALTPINNDLISTKLYYTYLSLYKDELLVKKMTGAANVTLTITSLSEVIVPFIPLKIQKKIEDILNLTEDFEMQTKQSKQLLQTLMQAVLKEAFEE